MTHPSRARVALRRIGAGPGAAALAASLTLVGTTAAEAAPTRTAGSLSNCDRWSGIDHHWWGSAPR